MLHGLTAENDACTVHKYMYNIAYPYVCDHGWLLVTGIIATFLYFSNTLMTSV